MNNRENNPGLELFNAIFQLVGFIACSYLLLHDIKQAIGLGYMIALIWWKLEEIVNNLKS